MTWRTEAVAVKSTNSWRDEAEAIDTTEEQPHTARSRTAQSISHAQDEADDLLRERTMGDVVTAGLTGAADMASGGALPALAAAVQGTKDYRPKWLQNIGIDFPTGDERPFAERKTEAEATRDDINARAPGAYAAGQAVGVVVPGATAGRAVSGGAAVARHAVPGSLVPRIARGAFEGGKAGAALGAMSGAGQSKTGELDDVAANATLGGVGGAVAGGAFGAAGAPAVMQTRLGSGGVPRFMKNLGIDVADVARVGNAVADLPYVGVPAKAARAIGRAIGVGGNTPKPRTSTVDDVQGYAAEQEVPSPWGNVEAPSRAVSSSSATAKPQAVTVADLLKQPAPGAAAVIASGPAPKRTPRAPAKTKAPKTADEAKIEALNAFEREAKGLATSSSRATSTVMPKGVQTGPAGQMRFPVDPHAVPGDRLYGVTMTMDEIEALQQAGKLRPIAPPHTPTMQEAARSLPLAPSPKPNVGMLDDATIDTEIANAIARGESMEALAARLKVPQLVIKNLYRSAQTGFPRNSAR